MKFFLTIAVAIAALGTLSACGGGTMSVEYRGDAPKTRPWAEKKLQGDGAGQGSGPSSSGQGGKF